MKNMQRLMIIIAAAALFLHPMLVTAEGANSTEDKSNKKLIGIVKLTSGNLNVRKGPTLDDEIIGKLPNGSQVEVLEQLEEWVKIDYDKSAAYVSKPYLVISEPPAVTDQKIVVLDPGHGGKDPGAIAKDGTYERTIVWQYAIKAKAQLEKAGYLVYMTHGEKSSCTPYKKVEEELACRASFAQKVNGDIFISIHADANASKKFRGTVTFYNARNDLDGNQNPYPAESKKLAQYVHSHSQPVMGTFDRGVQNKNYFVNRNNTVPSALIELGVLTNSEDLKLLKDKKRQDAFAVSLKAAVDEYFKSF